MAAMDNQRKEEILSKERSIQNLQLEKMENLHLIKALQSSLEEERNTVARIRSQKKGQRERELEEVQEQLEQTKFASYNHNMLLEQKTRQIEELMAKIAQKEGQLNQQEESIKNLQRKMDAQELDSQEQINQHKKLMQNMADKFGKLEEDYNLVSDQLRKSQTLPNSNVSHGQIEQMIQEKIVYKDTPEATKQINELRMKNAELTKLLKLSEDQAVSFDLTKSEVQLSSSGVSHIRQPREDATNAFELEKKTRVLTDQIKSTEAELEQEKKSHQMTIQDRQRKIENLSEELLQLKKRCEEFGNTQNLSSLNQTAGMEALQGEKITRLEAQNQKLFDQIHKLSTQKEIEVLQLKNELDKLKSEKSDSDYFKNLEVDQRSAKMAERLKAKIAQVGELNEEITALKIDNAKIKMDYDNLQVMVKKKYQIVAELLEKTDIEKANSNSDKHSTSLKYLAEQNKLLREKISHHENGDTHLGVSAQPSLPGGSGSERDKIKELEKQADQLAKENAQMQMKLMDQMTLINEITEREFLYRKLLTKHSIKPP